MPVRRGSEFIMGGERAGYKILTPEQALEIERIFEAKIPVWHDIAKPDIIVVTAASAVPYGLLIKRVWKHCYPNEDQPHFLTIDPRMIEGDVIHDDSNKRKPLSSGRALNRKVVLIFDECTTSNVDHLVKYFPRSKENTMGEHLAPEESVIEEGEQGDELGKSSLFLSAQYIRNLDVREVWLDSVTEIDNGEFLTNLARKWPLLQRVDEGGRIIGFFDTEPDRGSRLIRRSPDNSIEPNPEASKFISDLRMVADRIVNKILKK